MADIDIRRPHTLDRHEARDLANQVAVELGDSLGLSHDWRGDELHFDGMGVKGHIDVQEGEVRVRVRLGLLTSPLKGSIEQGIRAQLDRLLQA